MEMIRPTQVLTRQAAGTLKTEPLKCHPSGAVHRMGAWVNSEENPDAEVSHARLTK